MSDKLAASRGGKPANVLLVDVDINKVALNIEHFLLDTVSLLCSFPLKAMN